MLLLLFPIAILSKVYQYNFTSGLNFGIMEYIKNIVDTGVELGMNSYDYPAKIYSIFKFLGFTEHVQWSVFLTLIFTSIIFCMLFYYKQYSILEYAFIYASMFLLCWTVMNMNKDLIQLMFMLIIFKICILDISNNKKILYSSLIILYESIVFREYYIILCGMIIIIYYVLNRNMDIQKKSKYVFNIALIFVVFFAGIYICKYISYDAYEDLVYRRESLEGFDDVTTIIQNIIPGYTYPAFIGNYLINLVRILFPVELLQYGISQIIFFAYQLLMTIILIISMRKIDKKNVVFITIILAYVIMMAASESDFGTLARHQSVIFMFYLVLLKGNKNKEKIKNV